MNVFSVPGGRAFGTKETGDITNHADRELAEAIVQLLDVRCE